MSSSPRNTPSPGFLVKSPPGGHWPDASWRKSGGPDLPMADPGTLRVDKIIETVDTNNGNSNEGIRVSRCMCTADDNNIRSDMTGEFSWKREGNVRESEPESCDAKLNPEQRKNTYKSVKGHVFDKLV